MRDGVSGNVHINPLLTTSENFIQSLATLSFKLDVSTFVYKLEGVRQLDYNSMKLNFHVDYFFSAFDTNWSIKDKDVNVTVQVYGLWHPYYNGVIDNDWVAVDTNLEGISSYADQLFTSPGTSGSANIRPHCGNGEPNDDEQCDDGCLNGARRYVCESADNGDGCDAHCRIEVITIP
jgi:hypothetical protein